MNTLPAVTSFPADLRRAFGAEGETEYRQLLRVTKAARGSFFLFLIESDYTPARREAMLDCLRDDLETSGLHLRRLELRRDGWDIFTLPELETSVSDRDVFALVGMEDTPGLVPEPSRKPERPPIFALLNRLRESLHTRLPAPFLVWCTPRVYSAMQQHAPDFFDHYAGLFTFIDAAPTTLPERPSVATSTETIPNFESISPASARTAVAFYEQYLARIPRTSRERARMLIGMAEALLHMRDHNYGRHILHGLDVVNEALSLLSSERDPYEWGRAHGAKGMLYTNLPVGDQTQNLLCAIDSLLTALNVFNETDFSKEWATTQLNLGNAYAQLPSDDRPFNLQQAIAYYEGSLRVYTEADLPQDWAIIQNNLGNVYAQNPFNNWPENLYHAIGYYQSALRVYTESTFPQNWARTQNNLAIAYYLSPAGDDAYNLQQAIACYEAALRVYTETEFPQDWAMIQRNLGVAYTKVLTGGRTQNLWRSVDCCEAALRVYTEADFPQDWAGTQFNMALAHTLIGNKNAAQQSCCCAIAGFRRVGVEKGAQQAEALLQQLDAT